MLSTRDRLKKQRHILILLWAVALVLGVLAGTNGASAGWLPAVAGIGPPANPIPDPRSGDGFDALPPGLKARSMSSLVSMGLVRPPVPGKLEAVKGLKPYRNPPGVAIAWQPPVRMTNQVGLGYGANEPGAGMHPTNPFLALAGGNTYEPQPTHANVENTTDGWLTWHSQTVPNCSGYGDGVPLWLAANINDGNSAIYTSLCPGD